MKGLIFDIRHFSVHDGPGIRATVFFKGCPLKCVWCHNPESQLFEPEVFPRMHKLGKKEFPVKEVVGKTYTLQQVMAELEKDIAIFDESRGGVTFSGGEPLAHPEFLSDLLAACKRKEIHTAVDTCGFASESVIDGIIPNTDLFLYDLKLFDNHEHIKYTGVPNGVIIQNLERVVRAGKRVIIRIPLILGITDTEENLEGLRALIASHPTIQRVDLLPYHSIAKGKYERFGKEYLLDQLGPYDEHKARQIRDYFLERIPIVSIGG